MANDQDNLQQHLNNSIYGPPQTNPEERRHYLGSLRERAALLITNKQMADKATLPAFKQAFSALSQHTDYQLLLNGKLDTTITAPYLAAAAAAHFRFTLVNDETASVAPTECGLLIAAPNAIN